MIRTTVQVQWDAAAVAVVNEVLALRLMPDAVREEVARRLGVDSVSDKALRNGWERVMRRTDPAARFSYRGAATSSKPAQTPHTVRGLGKAEPEPVTQRSERVPSVTGGERVAVPMAAVGAVDGTERKTRTGLVAHDLHVPMHSPVWNDLAKQVAADLAVDTVMFNGDVLDCEALGSYGKRPKLTISFEDEIIAGNDFLDEWDAIGIQHKHILWGNHDQGRFNRYVAERAPDLHGMVSLESLLRLEERGWHVTDYKKHIYFGSTLLSHELGRGGKTAARRCADDLHCDVSIGHTHTFSMSVRADPEGKVITGSTFGWGADWRAAHYAHQAHVAATHILGFGLLTLDLETGRTHTEPVPIIDGRCVARGKVYVSRVPVQRAERRAA